MSSYLGRHAELYDIFYSEKEYQKEADFIHQCLSEYSLKPTKKILELACGTGSHAFLLEKKGYSIIATDYSEDMLNCAQKKAKKRSSKIKFRFQDMRTLDVPEGPFDSVICLFDSIGYTLTNEALIQVFRGVHSHLQDNGLFIFEFWHAAPMLKRHDPLRVKRWKTGNGEIIRISETSIDYQNQTGIVKFSVIELKDDKSFEKIEETQKNRFFLLQEMKMDLSQNGFVPEKFFAGFTDDEKITDETWHIIAVARRK